MSQGSISGLKEESELQYIRTHKTTELPRPFFRMI